MTTSLESVINTLCEHIGMDNVTVEMPSNDKATLVPIPGQTWSINTGRQLVVTFADKATALNHIWAPSVIKVRRKSDGKFITLYYNSCTSTGSNNYYVHYIEFKESSIGSHLTNYNHTDPPTLTTKLLDYDGTYYDLPDGVTTGIFSVMNHEMYHADDQSELSNTRLLLCMLTSIMNRLRDINGLVNGNVSNINDLKSRVTALES